MVSSVFYCRHETRKAGRDSGFTLIEILVVIMIIALILAIAVPVFIMARQKSQASVCVSHLRQIQGAKERWAIENKKDNDAEPSIGDLYPSYIKTRPHCPSGGEYSINKVSQPVVCSYGGSHIID